MDTVKCEKCGADPLESIRLMDELTRLYKEATGHLGTIATARNIIAALRKARKQ